MNDADPRNVEAQLAVLRERFALNLQQSLTEMQALTGADSEPVPELLQQLHDRLHRLAGAGGSFGHAELSLRAAALCRRLHDWLQPTVSAQDWQALRQALADLQNLAAPTPAAVPAAPRAAATRPLANDLAQVLLVHPDPALRDSLGDGLSEFGYAVTRRADAATALATVRGGLRPDLLLLALDAESGAQVKLLRGERSGQQLPVLLLADTPGFAAQLNAARSGGDDLLVRPVDTPTVAGSVERLLRERERPPCRVLIVDDDVVLAQHYQLVLRQAGMLAEWVSEPLEVPGRLERLRPDVLLMDLYMPHYNGAELAQAIRYEPGWQSLPIVFLSAEGDLNLQMQAMGSVADDFLVKPISDMQLIASVRARTVRARRLAELMSQDSLTGLLKHGSIKERLAHELERAARNGKAAAVAMVDIDHFKGINDRFGHPMGDQVIKALGRLLRQRLRRQDSVGRYGGEEFLLVLPECEQAEALRLIDNIRVGFGHVRFNCLGQSFGSSFSAGIASSSDFSAAQDLLSAADAALYRAKRGGRNCVCGAGTEETP